MERAQRSRERVLARTTTPGESSRHPVERLQRTVGNRGVTSLLGIQRFDEAPPDPAGQIASMPTIHQGWRGPSVAQGQSRLNTAGADPPLDVDSIFGPLTRAATVVFQAAHGLEPDGIIGPFTWGELLDSPTPVPPPPPPLLKLGDEGDDVGLLQQRLNAAGVAEPPLPIDAQFDVRVLAAVIRFQLEVMGTFPIGVVDQAVWDRLEQIAPGGEPDGGSRTHVESGTANAKGQQVAGTSTHPLIGPGGHMTGPAVEEFQQKLNIVRMGAGLEPIEEDGEFGTQTANATREYQTSVGLQPVGIGNQATWARLDQDAPTTTVGYVELEWTQEQGGIPTGMTGAGASRYSWRIAGDQILVTTKVDFRNNPPSPDWFGFVTDTWNKFKAVDGNGEEVNIDFQMVQGSGADANVVDVRTGTGRANAGRWFLGDTDNANTIPHEFGHLIGLRDEYQVHPGDYREITGHEPPVGESTGPTGVSPRQIARELQEAMVAHDDSAANAATVGRGLAMGAFSQRVVAEYAALPSVTVAAKPPPGPIPEYTTTQTDIARDLVGTLPNTIARYETIQVLTYTTGSTMGDPTRVTDPHDHGVRPRHVQEFCDLVAAARGGDWRVESR